jgi:hypothetical protein
MVSSERLKGVEEEECWLGLMASNMNVRGWRTFRAKDGKIVGFCKTFAGRGGVDCTDLCLVIKSLVWHMLDT